VAVCIVSASLAGCRQDLKNLMEVGLAWIEVQNSTSSALENVYVPPCAGGALGEDLLETGRVIPPGGLAVFVMDPGCYHVIGDFASGQRRTLQNIQLDPDLQTRVTFTN
jgi:hypothetical protein